MNNTFSGFLSELRAKSDIVAVVSETVRLKKSGSRYWGLCPFHNEKSPSFSVSQELGLYHCFGCKAGGDVIRFVMDTERLEFMDAVRLLADKANMRVPNRDTDEATDRARKTERDRLVELNRKAAQYFHSLLWTAEGRPILEYLHSRGLDDAAAVRFGLGASPAGGSAILKALASSDEDALLLVKAGLAIRKDVDGADGTGAEGAANATYYGFFRSRAMFPIINARGEVLGFGGRALGDAKPKYLNTGETPIFNKRLNVYGANLLRKEKGLERVILVEGYMDALSLINRGIAGVAATLGTALSSEQAHLLARYAPEIWIAYDADEAGQKAALRAVDICEAENIRARVLQFPVGKDPDEYIRSIPPDKCAAQFASLQRLSPARFRLMRLKLRFDMSDDEQRMRFAIEAGKILYMVKEPVELDDLLSRLVIETGYSKETLARQVQRGEAAREGGAAGAAAMGRAERAEQTGRMGGDAGAFDADGNADAYVADYAAANISDKRITRMTKADKAGRTLLAYIVLRKTGDLVKPEDFPRNDHQIIARMLLSGHTIADVLSDTEKDEDIRKETLEINGILTTMPEPADEDIPRAISDLLAVFTREKQEETVTDAVGRIKQGVDEESREALLRRTQNALMAAKRA